MSIQEVSFVHSRLVRFIDTLVFVPGNHYYMVDHNKDVSAIVVCIERDSKSAKFIRCYVIKGVWPNAYYDTFTIHANEPTNIIDNISMYELVPQIQIDQFNMIVHICADFEMK